MKLDHVLSAGNHLSARYFFDQFEFQRDTDSVPGIFADNRFRNQSFSIRDTHALSAFTVLTGSLNYSRHVRIQTVVTPITLQDLGADVPLANQFSGKELRVLLPGYFNLFGSGPLTFAPAGWEVRLGGSHSRRKHMLGFGVDVSRDMEDAIDGSTGSGQWNFNGSRTRAPGAPESGDTFADYLLGLARTFRQGASDRKLLREYKFHLWVQDDLKIRPNFTLNLGLRWEPWFPAEDLAGAMQGWLPGTQSSRLPKDPPGVVISGDPGVPRGVVSNDWGRFAPRLGSRRQWTYGASWRLRDLSPRGSLESSANDERCISGPSSKTRQPEPLWRSLRKFSRRQPFSVSAAAGRGDRRLSVPTKRELDRLGPFCNFKLYPKLERDLTAAITKRRGGLDRLRRESLGEDFGGARGQSSNLWSGCYRWKYQRPAAVPRYRTMAGSGSLARCELQRFTSICFQAREPIQHRGELCLLQDD